MELFSYLKKKKELLGVTGGMLVLSGVLRFLYGLSAGPFWYEALLLLVCLTGYLAAGYPAYCRKIRQLSEAAQLSAERLEALPLTEGKEEELYQQALAAMSSCLEEEKHRTQKELDEARRYYALWSHQIKTPLAALRLLLQEEHADRRTMEQELLKAEQYVEMALQYQRMVGETSDFLLKEYALLPLIKQAVKKTAPLFIYKKLGVSIAETTVTVVTDEKWFLFVLEQILTNAIKYTGEGTISIYMQGDELVVEDTGIGILAEDLPRVFEWGYTGFNGRLDKHSTGIGLSLCRQMLQKLGHGIRLESEPGSGTKVFLALKREAFRIE